MREAEAPRGALAIALVAYLAFIAYQSLAGAGSSGACVAPLVQQGERLSLGDGIANFVAYLPLGLLAAAWLGARRAPRVAWVAAFAGIGAFSLTMELVQACLSGRVSSWYDWLTNAAGGLVGLLTLSSAGRAAGLAAARRSAASATGSPLGLPLMLFAGAWLALTLAPWRFTLDVGTIRGNLSFLRQAIDGVALDPWQFVRHFFGWVSFGIALRVIRPAGGAAALALAPVLVGAVAGQLILAAPALSWVELAAMAAALVFTMATANAATARLAATLPFVALAAVAAYQLAPVAGAVTRPGGLVAGFSWWPRLGLGGPVGALMLSLLYCWLAFAVVLSLRWAAELGQDIGRRRKLLPAAIVLALLLTEFAQLWIPGRTADTSAPLIAALAFVVGWAVTAASPTGGRGRATSHRPVS